MYIKYYVQTDTQVISQTPKSKNRFCIIYSKSCEGEFHQIDMNGIFCLISIFIIKFSFSLYVNATNAWAVMYGYSMCNDELHFKWALPFIEYVNRKQITQH